MEYGNGCMWRVFIARPVKAASGELTKAEKNKQNQFAIRQEGFNYPTLKDIVEKGLWPMSGELLADLSILVDSKA